MVRQKSREHHRNPLPGRKGQERPVLRCATLVHGVLGDYYPGYQIFWRQENRQEQEREEYSGVYVRRCCAGLSLRTGLAKTAVTTSSTGVEVDDCVQTGGECAGECRKVRALDILVRRKRWTLDVGRLHDGHLSIGSSCFGHSCALQTSNGGRSRGRSSDGG